jgi:hypothetical protein
VGSYYDQSHDLYPHLYIVCSIYCACRRPCVEHIVPPGHCALLGSLTPHPLTAAPSPAVAPPPAAEAPEHTHRSTDLSRLVRWDCQLPDCLNGQRPAQAAGWLGGDGLVNLGGWLAGWPYLQPLPDRGLRLGHQPPHQLRARGRVLDQPDPLACRPRAYPRPWRLNIS